MRFKCYTSIFTMHYVVKHLYYVVTLLWRSLLMSEPVCNTFIIQALTKQPPSYHG